MTRASILTYIEARAKKLRDKAESGGLGAGEARIIETLAADIRAEIDVDDAACPKPVV